LTNQGDSTKSNSVNALRETASPPSVATGGVSVSGAASAQARAALYVDGFNLYHALDATGLPYVKWLDLWALGELILPRGHKEKLVKVSWFTAVLPGAYDKNERHREYMTALRAHNVLVYQGHFIVGQTECRQCGHSWDSPNEKESDVSLALTLFDDAY
jgi:hypothetical protein